MHLVAGLTSVFWAGFLYFISAIPIGAGLHLPLWLAVLAAWLGYASGAAVVIFAGQNLREWLTRKLGFDANPGKPSFIRRAWDRFGLVALGLLAPVTIGPQIGALLGLALGVPRWRLLLALALGGLPWAIGFALAFHFGVKFAR